MKHLIYCKYNFFYSSFIDDEDETEDIIPINQKIPVPSFLDAKSSVDVLRNYCEGLKVPTETRFFIGRFAQQIRDHRFPIPNTSATIDSFFGIKPKPK